MGARTFFLDGAFHHVVEGTTNVAALIVSPYGGEEFECRAPLRELASRLAQRGVTTLMFDYPGCGHSVAGAGRVTRMSDLGEATQRAFDLLAGIEGIDHIHVIGVRSGALAARRIRPSPGKAWSRIELEPHPNERHFIRERSLRSRLDESAHLPRIQPEGKRTSPPADGSARPASSHALCSTVELRDVVASQEQDEHSGVVHCPELLNIFLGPLFASLPDALWDEIQKLVPPGNRTVAIRLPPLDMRCVHASGSFSSEIVTLSGRFGILMRPAACRDEELLVLILCGGRDPGYGRNRSAHAYARGLARRGIASCTFDFDGVGDSERRSPERDGPPYDRRNVDAVADAMSRLEDLGFHAFVLAGICSGGHLALEAARDERVRGVICGNVQVFGRLWFRRVLASPSEQTFVAKCLRAMFRALQNGIQWIHLTATLARMAGRQPCLFLYGRAERGINSVRFCAFLVSRLLRRKLDIGIQQFGQVDHQLSEPETRRDALEAMHRFLSTRFLPPQ